MKNMKKLGRRSLALFLTFVMCLSLINITVFAVDTSKTGEVVEGAFVAENGQLGNFNSDASNTVSTPGGKVTVTKTATPVPCPDGNQFDVTLQVVTKDEKIETVTSPDAAVVLVIDVSGSMDDDDKLENAQASAIEFLESLKKNTPKNSDGTMPKRYVSLVTFSGSATCKKDWVDIMTDWGFKALKDTIDDLDEDGGTNLEQGLARANDQMKKSTVKGVAKENKFTVVLTDGKPTYAKSGWNLIGNGMSSQDDWKLKECCDEAINTAGSLKQNSSAIYSIYYGKSSDKCYDEHYICGQRESRRHTHTDVCKEPALKVKDFLAEFSSKVYTTNTAGELNTAFEQISQMIALLTQAWTVTDPMGSGVTFKEITTGQGKSVADCKGNVLTWNLRADTCKQGGTTTEPTYTYTLKYRVTVDSAAEGFDENAIHPLNGYTDLDYCFLKDGKLVDENGNVKGDQALDTIAFNVPGVKVKVPEAEWTIEYYKQGSAKTGEYENYAKVEGDTKSDSAKLWTKVVLSEKDNGYADKYARDNYSFAKAENEILTIAQDASKNVIKVYYNRDTTSATVNYHYTLTTIDKQGQEISTVYDVNGIPETGLFVGDEYSVEVPDTSMFQGYTYDKDTTQANNGTISELDKDGTKNVIDLYYVKVIDYRDPASVVVNHVYTLHTYELVDGKYVAKTVVTEIPNVQTENGRKAGETYTASVTPYVGYNGYQYEGISGRDNVVTLHGGENVINLPFANWEDPRGPELSLTVRHIYTKSVTTVENGQVVTTVDPNNVVGRTDTIKFYAGETVTATKQRVYNNDTYNIAGDSDTMVLPNPQNGSEYTLHYTLIDEPAKTSVTVNHIYQTVTHETVTVYEEVPVLDENGEPVLDEDGIPEIEYIATGTDTVETVTKDDSTSSIVEGLYVGQSYTAPIVGRDGYECQTGEAGRTEIVKADGSTEIDVYYLKDDGNVDNRDEATIDVQHVYTTHLTTVMGGEVKTIDVVTSDFDQTTTGKAGDTFKAEIKTTDKNGNEYTLVGSEPTEVVLHKGTNSTIVINYERAVSDLTEASYTVNYEYYTRTMTVVDGKAVWGEVVPDTETTKDSTGGTGYVGQKVELDTGAMTGYVPYTAGGNNPSATQFLTAPENSYTFKYVKDVPLAQFKLDVYHHITYKTITLDGESNFTQDVQLPTAYKYEGESYTAETIPNIKLILVRVDGQYVSLDDLVNGVLSGNITSDARVDFGYEVVNDYRVSVNYSVKSYYYDVDYNGTETLVGEPAATTGTSYAGMPLATTPEKEDVKGYKLTEATFNANDIMDQTSVTLVDGRNEIVYVYKRNVDTRPFTSVKVIHEYYASASATEPAYRDEAVTRDLRAPSQFTAEAVPTKNDVAYTQTTEDSALTITLDQDTTKNVITIKYVRAETTYGVVHEYYTNGTLTGSTSSVSGGTAGSVITADSIAKVTTYGGNTYSYTSASGAPLTLVQGENGTITLRYDRTTGGGGGTTGGGGGGGGTPPVNPTPVTPDPVVVIPEPDVPLVEIPEEDVPLAEIPEEVIEIPEEDVPLADVPKTGSNNGLWLSTAAVSALGLAVLHVKRKEDEEA